jgi:hypothetical protein
MLASTRDQAAAFPHKSKGFASFTIGAICIAVILLLIGIVLSFTELPSPMIAAMEVVPGVILCAGLIGIGLGIFGALDRSSRKLYPLLGITLNAIALMVFLAVALLGMLMNAP